MSLLDCGGDGLAVGVLAVVAVGFGCAATGGAFVGWDFRSISSIFSNSCCACLFPFSSSNTFKKSVECVKLCCIT